MVDKEARGKQLPITGLRVGEIPERVLVVGDPRRAKAGASLLDGAKEIAHNREYLSYAGHHHGQPVAIVSHGVGAAGAAPCFEELARAGARTLLRAGTAGGLQDDVGDGSLVVAQAAVRDDGTTDGLVLPGFPAVASPHVVLRLQQQLATAKLESHTGIVLTSSVFYPHGILGSNLELWSRAGCVAVEMECSVLFVIATLRGVEAGALLAIDGNPLARNDAAMESYQPQRKVVTAATERMLEVALDTLVR